MCYLLSLVVISTGWFETSELETSDYWSAPENHAVHWKPVIERADEDMVDAGADLDVDEGTDDDNDSDGEGADEDVAEFAGLAVNMLTKRTLRSLAAVLLNEHGATTLRFLSRREDCLVQYSLG